MTESTIAAQLYTVRQFTQTREGIAATFKKVRGIGYEAVQLSALAPLDPAELKRMADDSGLFICATHIPYERMRDDTDAVIAEHRTLECPYVGIGGLPSSYRSAEGFHRFAKEASEVGRRMRRAGLTFVYHNHSFELEKFGDRAGLRTLYDESDPEAFTSEIDTYWIQHGGGDPADWIRSLKGRAHVVHVKDMAVREGKPTFAEIGEGNLDWPGILDACKEAGTRWHIVEQDTCPGDPFDSLAISFRNMRGMGLR
ncbi:MAG: sugar phosphate isomerase/epimerase [Armatimonadetes bacterium]|nr:sugar phosphate isomerase/epimerase [Armatimonadota bacterium]